MANQRLTERETWLMRKAFAAGVDEYVSLDAWLDDSAADGGVTVQMVLEKEAPQTADEPSALKIARTALRQIAIGASPEEEHDALTYVEIETIAAKALLATVPRAAEETTVAQGGSDG